MAKKNQEKEIPKQTEFSEIQEKPKIFEKINEIKENIDEKSKQEEALESLKLEEVEEPDIQKTYTLGSQKYLSLLPQRIGINIQPEDFLIGSLHNREEASQDNDLIEKTISNFFDAMKMQTIIQSLLYEENPDENLSEIESSESEKEEQTNSELYRRLMYHIENNNIPQKYRIGRITINKINTANVIVRIFGEKSETQGEVFLIKKQNSWYIVDMQINFYEIEIPTENNEEKFLPTTYNWIFQEM